jgi:hydrogenase expression/formation protein HypC
MCIGVPGRVIEVPGDPPGVARVEVQGVRRTVGTLLLEPPPQPGDWVLVYLGLAMSRLTPAEARETLDLLDELALLMADDGPLPGIAPGLGADPAG